LLRITTEAERRNHADPARSAESRRWSSRDMVDTAFAAARAHLSAPHYTDMLRQAGIPAEASHPRKGAELLVESGTFVSGTPQEIAAGLDVYRAHGVGEVILNLCGVLNAHGLGAAITDLTDILTAVDGTHG
ncbi:hypothetical protein ABT086_24320, partial [Streptomyces mirabilis]